MTARIIDGKALAREVEAQARARSEALASLYSRVIIELLNQFEQLLFRCIGREAVFG